MIRREFLACASASVVSAFRSWGAQTRTNVVFMVADDMNTALGCYGHPIVKTPNLDRFAGRAVVFDRAYCQFPLCAPSRASFLSGRRPDNTRVLSLTVPTRRYMQNVVFLPELFRKNGYWSADCGKIYHTGPEHDDPRSWDFVLQESGKRPPKSEVIESHEAREPRNHSMDWAKLRTPDEKTPDGIVASTAVEQIRTSLDNKRPFFVAIGFRRPHSPYSVPAKYFDLYQPARIPLPSTSNDPQLPEAAWYELANQPALSEKEQREYIAAYYACNSFVDAQAGVVFSALDKLELWDRTVVVFFGDHGYHTGEHAMWHKMTLFEQSTRVPLIVHVPGVRGAGQRSRGLVELLDLYPTLAEACGLEAPPGLEGRSLTPLLHNPSRTGKEAVFSMVGRHQERNLSHKEPQYFGRSVRTVHWRYTEWDQGRRGVELYDLNADPRETRNLARSPGVAQVVSKMKALLQTGGRSTGS
jgi:iduronate 2-sulfatase